MIENLIKIGEKRIEFFINIDPEELQEITNIVLEEIQTSVDEDYKETCRLIFSDLMLVKFFNLRIK